MATRGQRLSPELVARLRRLAARDGIMAAAAEAGVTWQTARKYAGDVAGSAPRAGRGGRAAERKKIAGLWHVRVRCTKCQAPCWTQLYARGARAKGRGNHRRQPGEYLGRYVCRDCAGR
jgi:hypothetical protein